MLSRSTCFISCRLLIMALAMSLAAGCAIDVDEPPLDEPSDEAELTPADEESDVGEPALASECTNDAGCSQGFMCVKPAFKPNYCAQLCVYDGIGEHNCPPGFNCTRPFFWNRYRCTPD